MTTAMRDRCGAPVPIALPADIPGVGSDAGAATGGDERTETVTAPAVPLALAAAARPADAVELD